MLRSDGDAAELAPAPGGLKAVPGLVASMRAAGVHVELEISGVAPGLPAPVGAAGFRIVQRR